jgi:hypothetical protein
MHCGYRYSGYQGRRCKGCKFCASRLPPPPAATRANTNDRPAASAGGIFSMALAVMAESGGEGRLLGSWAGLG